MPSVPTRSLVTDVQRRELRYASDAIRIVEEKKPPSVRLLANNVCRETAKRLGNTIWQGRHRRPPEQHQTKVHSAADHFHLEPNLHARLGVEDRSISLANGIGARDAAAGP